ncbi:hypothetical protein HU200_027897 [Digitaria exilis]|uniref:F-box/LRR-repeat protein 15/At3g58940/PEG3-like LRR domain-containing protein n=1 Tax=Digitaria exilis TaxID=1010633 RepID=A0A835BVD8_9POAL|nr:hypothetical protein HU200_027897 [Digitaria exilis]
MDPSRLSGGHEGQLQLAAKLAEDVAGVDRLSALPNDVLLRILARLGDAAAAARTSVLAGRWRRLWALLPELRFPSSPSPRRHILSALLAHEAPLTCLDVGGEDAAPESVAAWLPTAARRLSGSLVFTNRRAAQRRPDSHPRQPRGRRLRCSDQRPRRPENDDLDAAGEERGDFELPCFGNATTVSLDLGWLGLAVPRAAGVFARLTELSLNHVRFHRPAVLGDAVSSRRCPCLEKLTVQHTLGLSDLTIRSNSVRHMELAYLRGLQQLTVDAPALEHLSVVCCFHRDQIRPVANISARQVKELRWADSFDRRSVKLGKMKHLQSVCPMLFLVYGIIPNDGFRNFLRCFKIIQELCITVVYMLDIDNLSYLMEDIKMLPDVASLDLRVVANGHATGASLFHVLKMCSGIRELILELSSTDLEVTEQTACPVGCVCGQQQNWKTEQLMLNRLQEVEITELRGSENELTFMKKLFSWATMLKKMTVTFKSLVTESRAKELCLVLRSFSRPEISLKFYIYNKDKIKVLYVPED